MPQETAEREVEEFVDKLIHEASKTDASTQTTDDLDREEIATLKKRAKDIQEKHDELEAAGFKVAERCEELKAIIEAQKKIIKKFSVKEEPED